MPRQKQIVVEEPKNAKLPVNGFFACVLGLDAIPKQAPWYIFMEMMTPLQRMQALFARNNLSGTPFCILEFLQQWAAWKKQNFVRAADTGVALDDADVLQIILDHKLPPLENAKTQDLINMFRAGDKKGMSTWLDTHVQSLEPDEVSHVYCDFPYEAGCDLWNWNDVLRVYLDLP